MIDVCFALFVVGCLVWIVCSLLCVSEYVLRFVSCLLFVVCCLSCLDRCVLTVVCSFCVFCWLLFVDCCLLFNA